MSDCYRETPRTARKAHTCCECMDTIDLGERYVSIGVVWEGTAETFKLCAFCHALFEQIWRIPDWVPEDGPSFGGLCAWLHECFWRDDPSGTEAVIDGVFPLVDMGDGIYLSAQTVRKEDVEAFCARLREMAGC